MSTVTNPLARFMFEAQAILVANATFTGPSKADTIKALNDLLRGPQANAALLFADSDTNKKVAEARAEFLPSLEAAQSKLAEVRQSAAGMPGMSLDRVQLHIGTALMLAREGSK
jgi:hypothetical protein